MEWEVSDKELKAILSLPGEKRYEYFVKKIADWEQIWSLRNQDGWVLASSDAVDMHLVPVWPHQKYVAACLSEEWDNCKPASISLKDWIEKWIPGMLKDNLQVAVFPTPSDKGIIIHPSHLLRDLETELEKYGI